MADENVAQIPSLREVLELDDAYPVVAEMLEYFDSYSLATWAPLAAIILRERGKAHGETL